MDVWKSSKQTRQDMCPVFLTRSLKNQDTKLSKTYDEKLYYMPFNNSAQSTVATTVLFRTTPLPSAEASLDSREKSRPHRPARP